MPDDTSLNPYTVETLVDDSQVLDQTIDDDTTRYVFEGAVRKEDVYRAFRRIESIVGLCLMGVMLPLLLLFGFVWAGSTLRFMSRWRAPDVPMVLCMIVLSAVVIGVWWSLRGNARTMLRRGPLILGDVRGFVSPHRIVIERTRVDLLPGTPIDRSAPVLAGEYLLNALLDVEQQRDFLLLSFDANRISQVLLPLRLFAEQDRDRVRHLLMEKQTHNAPLTAVLDPRLIENQPIPSLPPVAGAIPFAGRVFSADLEGSPLEASLRRYRKTLMLATTLGAIMIAAPFLVPSPWRVVFLMSVPVGLALMLAPALAFWRLAKLRDPDQCLFQVAGWISEQQIHTAVATSSTIYTWAVMVDYAITTRAIALRLPGVPERHVILAKRTFEDDAAWELACRWVRAGMAASRRAGAGQRSEAGGDRETAELERKG